MTSILKEEGRAFREDEGAVDDIEDDEDMRTLNKLAKKSAPRGLGGFTGGADPVYDF